MWTIFKDFDFAAAHFIPEHPGKCRNLHGHNYRVRVHVTASRLDRLDMVVDFALLKRLTRDVVDRFDHRLLNELEPFDQVAPTAERIAEHIALEIGHRLRAAEETDDRVRVSRVEVWETDTSCAIYDPSD